TAPCHHGCLASVISSTGVSHLFHLSPYSPRFTGTYRAGLPYPGRAADTGCVSPYASLAIVILLPTAAGYVILGAVRGCRFLARARRVPAPAAEPIERLGARLRRVRAEIELTEDRQSLLPKKHPLPAPRAGDPGARRIRPGRRRAAGRSWHAAHGAAHPGLW